MPCLGHLGYCNYILTLSISTVAGHYTVVLTAFPGIDLSDKLSEMGAYILMCKILCVLYKNHVLPNVGLVYRLIDWFLGFFTFFKYLFY